jgi:hypothetical protein
VNCQSEKLKEHINDSDKTLSTHADIFGDLDVLIVEGFALFPDRPTTVQLWHFHTRLASIAFVSFY